MRTVVSRRRRVSANAPAVRVALAADPGCWIVVDGLSNEAASAAVTGQGVDPRHQSVVELYVHAHV